MAEVETFDHDLVGRKAVMRQSMSATRAALADAAGEDHGMHLADHFMKAWVPDAEDTVSGFWPIHTEIDLKPLLWRLDGAGVTVALPRMLGPSLPLEFRSWRAGDELVRAKFGVQEPSSEAEICRPNMVLVPLLAFDGAGNRLGYGGGFYDRTLAELGPETKVIGVAFAGQQVDDVPVGPEDHPLDGIVTEAGSLKFKR